MTIDDDDFDIAPQAVMLQAIVADNDIAIRMGGEQRISCRDAIAADKKSDLGARRNQHRFIADFDRIAQRPDLERAALGPTIAAADHARHVARKAQLLDQPDDKRCFAAAADADIADDDDRHRQSGGTNPALLVCHAARCA